MKQTIQLRIGQSLTMTPQLQQAIKLLQLSTFDLQTEIQQALDDNPMLEVSDDETATNRSENELVDYSGVEVEGVDKSSNTEADSSIQMTEKMNDMPDELPVDSAWEDTFDSVLPQTFNTSQESTNYENQDASSDSLQEHLLWQLNLTPFSDRDRTIAASLIEAIDDQGYLSDTLEEIYDGLRGDDPEIELDEVEAVLNQIQNFDPIGVGARDLQECLLIQLHHLDPSTPRLRQAEMLVKEHLSLLANRDFTQLMRRMKCENLEMHEIINLVQSLNPRPGSLYSGGKPEYIIPDIIVKKIKDSWRVELNMEALPRVRINNSYANMVKRADNSSDNTYLKNHLQEARWFLKSLQSRNETLLKVATCIVERQRGFLEYGEEAMKALVLHDVAESVEMHESTISRVTTQKYMHTPRGIFELKYFFSSHVGTINGGECSATAIRALIKKLVAAENSSKPLSDSKIAQILSDQGINVARRTIAKYRESISIPSSSERKQLA